MTAPPDNLGFHAEHPAGEDRRVLLLFRADSEGLVAFREWGPGDHEAPGSEGVAPVGEVEARVRRWAREGWKLTEHPERICAWLRAR